MKFLTVGMLRQALVGLSDQMPVAIEIDCSEAEPCDLAQGELRAAEVETRCDEVERLYLWADGNVVDDGYCHCDDPESIPLDAAACCRKCGKPEKGDVKEGAAPPPPGYYWASLDGNAPFIIKHTEGPWPSRLVRIRGPLKPPRKAS